MYTFDRIEFGKRLLYAIREKGLSQTSFSKYSGINRWSVVAYCQGRTLPSAETLSIICNILDTDANWLLGKEGVDYEPPEQRFVLPWNRPGCK